MAFDRASAIDRSDSSGKSGGLLKRSPRVVRRAGEMSQLFVSCIFVKAVSKIL
jgi:hypothetical protein